MGHFRQPIETKAQFPVLKAIPPAFMGSVLIGYFVVHRICCRAVVPKCIVVPKCTSMGRPSELDILIGSCQRSVPRRSSRSSLCRHIGHSNHCTGSLRKLLCACLSVSSDIAAPGQRSQSINKTCFSLNESDRREKSEKNMSIEHIGRRGQCDRKAT